LVEECVEEKGRGDRWRIIEEIKQKLLLVDTGKQGKKLNNFKKVWKSQN